MNFRDRRGISYFQPLISHLMAQALQEEKEAAGRLELASGGGAIDAPHWSS